MEIVYTNNKLIALLIEIDRLKSNPSLALLIFRIDSNRFLLLYELNCSNLVISFNVDLYDIAYIQVLLIALIRYHDLFEHIKIVFKC